MSIRRQYDGSLLLVTACSPCIAALKPSTADSFAAKAIRPWKGALPV